MVVKVEQLIPGTILVEDVLGKSSKPLIARHTVLNEKHIYFLNKFLIDQVRVESRLQDGSLFIPK